LKDLTQKQQFIELRAKGWSFDRISKELHTSKATLITWSKELDLEVKNRRELEREALLEQLSLTHECRIQFIGDLMAKIRQELMSRSLTNVPSERLFEMALKALEEWQRVSPALKLGMEEDLLLNLNKSMDKTIVNWSA